MTTEQAPSRRDQLIAARDAIRRQQAKVSFREFLNHWTFRDREHGPELTFGDHLWPGQERLVDAMTKHKWLFALKAGKLGFTELECAWDGWRAVFGPPNSRVHLFSKDGSAAEELLEYVRFGLTHLPPSLAPTILAEKPGGDTMTSLRLRPPMWAAQSSADIRVIRAYNAAKRPGVDLSCVHGDTMVLTAAPNGHGRPQAMRIRRLVREKYAGEVLTLNPATESVEHRRVTGWYKTPLAGRQMYALRLRHAAGSKNGIRVAHLTGDHLVLTADGWLRADLLTNGMSVATGEAAPNAAQAAVLTGNMLGDGHVRFDNRMWATAHVDWEYSGCLWRALAPLDLVAVGHRPPSDRKPHVTIRSRESNWAGRLRDAWYDGRTKRVNRAAIEAMGDIGLATWFLDDGWLHKQPSGCRCGAGFATQGFLVEDVCWLISFLNRQGISCIHRGNNTIWVDAEGAEVLMKRIGCFIPPGMERKRTATTPSYDPAAWETGKPSIGFDEALIEPWTPPSHERSVYCLDVEGTHNFVTFGGTLHNCQHAHLDELWALPFAPETWSAVASTVAPGGSLHIVTRGGGQGNFVTELWEKAKAGTAELHPFFEPWSARTDRDRAWYDEQKGKFTINELAKFAPDDEEDALYATDIAAFVPLSVWDACRDPTLPPYLPGNKEVAVMGIDAAVGRKTGVADTFGIVVVTRHPGRPRDVAIRAVRKWEPPRGGQLDLSEPEDFVFALTLGGCAAGHHRRRVGETLRAGESVCAACEAGVELERFNIHTVVYDPSQMVYLAQKFKRELNCAVREFSQQNPRSAADRQLYDLIISNRIAHHLDEPFNSWMREHVGNAVMRFQTREDSKMRIDKRAEHLKVDLLVAASMAVHECLRLLLTDTG